MPTQLKHSTPQGFKKIQRKHGKRIVFSPSKNVRRIHRKFLKSAEAFPITYQGPGHLVASHLECDHRFFLSTDLADAFEQVTMERLSEALVRCGISRIWLRPQLFFFHEKGDGGLIQGSLCSPYLFETYCRYGGLDSELSRYCDTVGFHFTRYVDDILISSSRPIGRRVLPRIREIVGKHGFRLKEAKTQLVDARIQPVLALGYYIRGNRVDPAPEIFQKLFDLGYSSRSVPGLWAWIRKVREQRGDVQKRLRKTPRMIS